MTLLSKHMLMLQVKRKEIMMSSLL